MEKDVVDDVDNDDYDYDNDDDDMMMKTQPQYRKNVLVPLFQTIKIL